MSLGIAQPTQTVFMRHSSCRRKILLLVVDVLVSQLSLNLRAPLLHGPLLNKSSHQYIILYLLNYFSERRPQYYASISSTRRGFAQLLLTGFLPLEDVTERADLWAAVFSTPRTSQHYPFVSLSDLILFLPLLLPPSLQLSSHHPNSISLSQSFSLSDLSPCLLDFRVSHESPPQLATAQAFCSQLVWGRWVTASCGVWWLDCDTWETRAYLQISSAPHPWSCAYPLHRICNCFSLSQLSLQILPSTLLQLFCVFQCHRTSNTIGFLGLDWEGKSLKI